MTRIWVRVPLRDAQGGRIFVDDDNGDVKGARGLEGPDEEEEVVMEVTTATDLSILIPHPISPPT